MLSIFKRMWNGERHTLVSLVMSVLFICLPVSVAGSDQSPTNDSPDGARIYAQRCVLCHGNYGAGDGFLPLIIQDYPNTNLLQDKTRGHFNDLQNQIVWGGVQDESNDKSPPWTGELSSEEVDAVTQFVVNLKENPEQHWETLNRHFANEPVSLETGRLVFQTRCAICHGTTGEGDGRMSVIVKSPPPANLSLSRLPDSEIIRIISLGGPEVGRSVQMPRWANELTEVQIKSVSAYIQLLRQ